MVSERMSSALAERESIPVSPEMKETTAPQGSGVKRFALSEKAKLRLKLLLSLLMFAGLFAFGKVDLSKSVELIKQTNLFYLGIAATLMIVIVFINALRWQLLAAAIGFKRPLLQLAQYCFVGTFFNLFLPSTVGGDFSRCYYLSKGTGRYHHAAYSVLADRVIGIAVLFAFAAFGILLGPGGGNLPWQLKLPIFGGTAAIFGLVPLMPFLTRTLLGSQNKIAQRFNNSVVQTYWQDRGLICLSLVLSVVMQLVMVLCHVAVGYALNITNIPIWYYFIFYPSVAVLGFVTPSFNGVGIREWAYTYFLTAMGIDRAHALTYAVMWLGLNTALCLVGGLVYVSAHLQISKEEAEKIQYDTI